jgi:hypothetical protein
MNKLLLLPLIIMIQGCVTWQRTWNLGVCEESATGAYGCLVKVPKSAAAVHLSAKIEPLNNAQVVPSTDLKVKLRNNESHTIEIEGLDAGAAYLKPGEDFVVLAKRDAGGWAICSFDTSEGAIRFGVEILGGKPAGTTICIRAHSSDAP